MRTLAWALVTVLGCGGPMAPQTEAVSVRTTGLRTSEVRYVFAWADPTYTPTAGFNAALATYSATLVPCTVAAYAHGEIQDASRIPVGRRETFEGPPLGDVGTASVSPSTTYCAAHVLWASTSTGAPTLTRTWASGASDFSALAWGKIVPLPEDAFGFRETVTVVLRRDRRAVEEAADPRAALRALGERLTVEVGPSG